MALKRNDSVHVAAPDLVGSDRLPDVACKNVRLPYQALEKKLYFQGGAPTDTERDEITKNGKSVVLITSNIHSSEIGSSQHDVDLVYKLATDNSRFGVRDLSSR